MSLERHYTTAELATLLNCSTDTILRLAQRGELRSSFVGRERRYPESGVHDYLERGQRRAAPQLVASSIPVRRRRAS